MSDGTATRAKYTLEPKQEAFRLVKSGRAASGCQGGGHAQGELGSYRGQGTTERAGRGQVRAGSDARARGDGAAEKVARHNVRIAFHVIWHARSAVDKMRRIEQRTDKSLKGLRWSLPKNRAKLKPEAATIRAEWQRHGVLVDPDTADSVKVAREHLEPDVPMIVLETAQPTKFAATIVEAIGREPPSPGGARRHRATSQALHGDAGRRRTCQALHRRQLRFMKRALP